jgi:hypothetical protein
VKVSLRFPAGNESTVDRVLGGLVGEPEGGRLGVGDERVREFLTAFSKRLLRGPLARRYPELASLGFFLRPGEIARALQRLNQGAAGARRFPRGVVLHFPPANVDTIFVYSWALSALAGNTNLVRISPRSAGAAESVIDALNETLANAHPVIGQTQRMFTYERDDQITSRLSLACDLRVIWGGDASVEAIRHHPLAPHARDLTFPDRSSFAAVSVQGWLAADETARRAAVDGFANDTYWFDQAACSSPRAVFWVGDEAPAGKARAEFMAILPEVVRARGWNVDAAMAVEKRVATYGLAATGAATAIEFAGNAVASVDLVDADAVPRRWLGAGTICHLRVDSLSALVPTIGRKDQTLAQFGFSRAELDDFITAVAGRGIDRVVPFGSALTFAAVWDGYDLLHEFTRLTHLS